jgi:hypothetical protein
VNQVFSLYLISMKSISNCRPVKTVAVLMKNRKNKSKHNTLDSIIHHNFLSMNKQLSRRDAILLTQDTMILRHGVGCVNVGKDLESQG